MGVVMSDRSPAEPFVPSSLSAGPPCSPHDLRRAMSSLRCGRAVALASPAARLVVPVSEV